MPARAHRECSHPGCRTLTQDGTGRCPVHPRPAWVHSAKPVRFTGRKLQAARAALFARQPLCEECARQGRTTEATIRDHRIPLAEGGTDDPSNEQALCYDCHDLKTQEESARGVRAYHSSLRPPAR